VGGTPNFRVMTEPQTSANDPSQEERVS
jgi:hypothetical protein